MSNSNKNPWEEEIDLSVYDEIDDYISKKVQEVLETQHIDENQSREIFEKQFNNDLERMRNLCENLLKEKCEEMGIDPESLYVDWRSMKVEEKP